MKMYPFESSAPQQFKLEITIEGSPEAIQRQFAYIAKAVAAGDWDSYLLNGAGGGGGGGVCSGNADYAPFSYSCHLTRPPEPPLSENEVRKLRNIIKVNKL